MGNWIWILMDEQMDFIMEMNLNLKMEMKMSKQWETIMENKFGKTIWLQRMIKMMDKIDNFRSKRWIKIGYKNDFYNGKRV